MRPDVLMSRSLILAGLLFACASPLAAADLSPQEQIEQNLMCYCGCSDLTVRVCTCGTAAAIKREIATRLADGESKEEVLAAFVARHGEQILSAPTKEGFNLLAWIMPFAVILTATTALVLVIRRWETRGAVARENVRAEPSSKAGLTDAERLTLERVEREMRENH